MNLPDIRLRNERLMQALAGPQGRAMAARIVRNDAGPARLDVYDDIGGGGWFGGISASDVVAQLAEIQGPVEVHINSGGGDVFDGIAIYNALNARSGVTIVVDGIAASIASIIAQAGESRVIAPGAMLMIHDALSLCIGNAADMRETADLLDQVSDNLASIYAARGGTVADWRAAMQAETWYTAQDAVDAGLMDKLADRPAKAEDVANHDFTVFAHVPRWVRAAAGQDGDGEEQGGDAPACKTCGGSGRLKHPATGKNGAKCPGCDGSGKAPQSGDADGSDSGDESGMAGRATVLGSESMPLTDGPIPVHHTATVDSPWDGPAAVAAMPTDDTVLEYCHAWETEEAAKTPHREGDDDADDQKGSYKFPHHEHKGGPANVNACSNGLARLEGSTIPAGDKAGVRAHLQAHLDDSHKGESSDHHHSELSGAALVEFAQLLREGIN